MELSTCEEGVDECVEGLGVGELAGFESPDVGDVAADGTCEAVLVPAEVLAVGDDLGDETVWEGLALDEGAVVGLPLDVGEAGAFELSEARDDAAAVGHGVVDVGVLVAGEDFRSAGRVPTFLDEAGGGLVAEDAPAATERDITEEADGGAMLILLGLAEPADEGIFGGLISPSEEGGFVLGAAVGAELIAREGLGLDGGDGCDGEPWPVGGVIVLVAEVGVGDGDDAGAASGVTGRAAGGMDVTNDMSARGGSRASGNSRTVGAGGSTTGNGGERANHDGERAEGLTGKETADQFFCSGGVLSGAGRRAPSRAIVRWGGQPSVVADQVFFLHSLLLQFRSTFPSAKTILPKEAAIPLLPKVVLVIPYYLLPLVRVKSITLVKVTMVALPKEIGK